MDKTEYIFEISALDPQLNLEQVCQALEKRTELASRARCPGIWRFTDRLRQRKTASEAQRKRHQLFMRIISIVNLLLGIVLLVPGLMSPKELPVPLAVGAIAVAAGILGLCAGVTRKKSRFTKAAKTLLTGNGSFPAGGVRVLFLENGFAALAGGLEPDAVPYSECEYLIEAGDIFLLTFRNRAMLLQKRDLAGGNVSEFCGFISSKLCFVPEQSISA